MKSCHLLFVQVIAAALCLASACEAGAATRNAWPVQLEVERREQPLGLDVRAPRFSWRSDSKPSVHGVVQTGYQISVLGPGQQPVWDSGWVEDSHSLEIGYRGPPLQPETRYDWRVTVGYGDGSRQKAESWFETGLLHSDAARTSWEGADWIGGAEADRVLYAPYFPLYDIAAEVTIAPGSQRVSLVFAANDPRLMDRNQNLMQLENGRDQSYFEVELDVGALAGDSSGLASLNVYRVGYSHSDTREHPVRSFLIRRQLISAANAHAAHRLQVRSEFGVLSFSIDGNADPFEGAPGAAPPRVDLNPMAQSGASPWDVVTFGQLSDIGFAIGPGQSARIGKFAVYNTRSPRNAVFREDLPDTAYRGIFAPAIAQPQSALRVERGAYVLQGGARRALIVADPSHNAMPMLRSEFVVDHKQLKAARLYVSARGIYELQLNGRRVGADYYNPGLSQYDRTQYYQTYDVTAQLQPGTNAIGAQLGEGWWSGLLSYGTKWNHFGDRQSLLAKLVLTYADGTRRVVTTNPRDWKFYADGPLVYSSLVLGEIHDATREPGIRGWSTRGFDDRHWRAATAVGDEGMAAVAAGEEPPLDFSQQKLVGQVDEPPTVYRTLTARSVREVRPGVFLYDFGQNVVGVPQLQLRRMAGGRKIILRVAELLYPDRPESGANVGMLMTENYRAALSIDRYLTRPGDQIVQPRFTAHGFQYLEVTGLDTALPLAAVKAVAISSVRNITAHYESSSAAVNQLWSNIIWSNVDNFLSIPTDCPQRNERMGWSGDLSVFARTATYLSAAAPFLERHLQALRDSQLPSGKFPDIAPVGGGFGGVLWGSAGITVPWELYQQYGDIGALRAHYPSMVAYAEYLATTLDPVTGFSRDAQLGDWLGPQNLQIGQPFLSTAYHVYDLAIMTAVAGLLGERADAERFARWQQERKAFFNRTFIDPQGRTRAFFTGSNIAFGPDALKGEMRSLESQSGYAVALALGVIDADKVSLAQQHLAAVVAQPGVDDQGNERPAYSLMTGFIGTAWISTALSQAGRSDLAYRQLLTETFPSWLYPVKQGATTIWERLNGYTREAGFGGNNSMNSFNHYSFGAVGQWLVSHSLGIQRAEPGFHEFLLQPEPDAGGGIGWARGSYDSPYGRIESSWRVRGNRTFYELVIPANTGALFQFPARAVTSVTESGRPLEQVAGAARLGTENDFERYRLGSGRYRIEVTRQ